jgi:polar amino acid transport system ATP-binding protein
MIEIQNLHKSFGNLRVLNGISAEISDGECIALIGGSGAGKSVFLRCLAMLEMPDEGRIIIDGQDITAPGVNLNKVRERMGMVYQGFHLFSHLNVLDNITLAPCKILKQPKPEAERKAMELLELVGLASKAKSMPRQLSGGQSQRIAIARCLAMNPKVILFDEPTSALDPVMTGEVLAIIRSLLGRGITMLLVTHEMKFAEDAASRVFFLDEGTIYEQGSPEQIFHSPQKPKTIRMIKKLKLFETEISDRNFDWIAMFSRVRQFCEKYGLTKWMLFTVQLVLEEILTTLLNIYFSQCCPKIRFTLEYSETDKSMELHVFYQGENVNIFTECMDEVQQKILTGKCRSRIHTYSDEINEIQLTL